MSIESSLDLILVLLYAPGSTKKICEEVKGPTRLVKLLFLLVKEGGFERFEKDLSFETHDYGPWAGEIYDEVETLKQIELLQVNETTPESYDELADEVEWLRQSVDIYVPTPKKVPIYILTDKGKIVGEKLYESLTVDERRRIEEVKSRFNPMTLNKLLQYVYTKYPEVTIKSKIKEKVLPASMFGSSPELPKFKREEDFRS